MAGADGLFSFPHKPAKGIKAAPAASIEGWEGPPVAPMTGCLCSFVNRKGQTGKVDRGL